MSKSLQRAIIERAIELMKKGWIQGYEAVDEEGRDVPPQSDKARAFCAVGAIRRASCEFLGKNKWRATAMRIERACDAVANEMFGRE